MTAATIVQIVGWGVQLVSAIGKIVTDAISAAQAGAAPTLEDLDKRLAADQARMAKDRWTAAKAAAEAELVKAAEAQFDAELKTVAEPKKP